MGEIKGEKEKNLALCLFMARLGAAGECVPAHTYETVKNHSQTRKFPTKGSQGTWKWIFFS